MDACVAVEKEIDKVLAKFCSTDEQNHRKIEELIVYLHSLRQDVINGPVEIPAGQHQAVMQSVRKVKDALSNLSNTHKDLHSSVSKIGKAIDRNFQSDLDSCAVNGAFTGEDSQKCLNEVVCNHFIRQGMIDVSDQMITEAQLEMETCQKEPFLEMNRVLECLKHRKLEPALDWAVRNHENLRAQNSSLEFKLHRLKFISLLSGGIANQANILNYAKNFQQFAESHKKEIQALMGSLIYLRQQVELSPYRDLFNPLNWVEIAELFMKDCCSLLGLSLESPLSVSFHAGSVALPALINIKHVMQQRQCSGLWTAKDELPIEVDLGRQYRFHSVFACPILRQQASDKNPPMRLVCGHVISRDALNKLINTNKVKCPYCPMEQSPSDAKQIYL